MANVTMQLLLELRQFRQAWDQAATAAQQGAQKISRSAQQGGRAMEQAGKKATGFAGAIEFLKKRVIGAGLFFAAFYQGLITLRQFIGAAVAELFNLDDALRRVQSITKESDAAIDRLKDQLIGLAKEGKLFDQSAADVADSMFSIAQAGFSSAEALTLARIAAEGAAVGFTTAETSATLLVSVLKAYDLPVSEARHVMDVLFQTVDTGMVTFEALTAGLGKVLSSASALNVPLEEVGAAVATMTLRGFTGAQAMTSLGRMMQTFIRPSQRAKDVAAEFGIELSAATIQSKGFIATLQEMFLATGGNVTKFSAMFDQIQATRGAVSLFSDNGKLLTAVLIDMGVASADAGAMAKAMEERAKSLKFQLSVLRSQALAVVVDALEPLMDGLAGVLGNMNNILAGRNAFFNYFANLKALVTAVVVAFLFMKRVAIQDMFRALGHSLARLPDTMRLVAMKSGVLKAGLVGLGGILTTLAPMLVFLAVFALSKFATQMDNADRAMRTMADATAQFEEKLAGLRELNLPEDILHIKELELATDSLEGLIGDLVGDFQKAADEVDDLFGVHIGAGVGEALDQVARGIFTLGMSTGSELDKIRGKFRETVDQWIEGADLSGKELTALSEIFRNLERDAETSKQAELYRLAAEQLGLGAANASETERFIREARRAAQDFAEETGQAIIPVSDVKEGIEKWLQPLKDAKDIIDGILGLTTDEDLLLRAAVAPIEERIAARNAEIAEAKLRQLQHAEQQGVALADLLEAGDAIVTKDQEIIDKLERQNELDGARVGALETQKGILDAHNETIGAQVTAWLGVGNTLRENQLPLLYEALAVANRGPEAFQGWIDKQIESGRVLDEEVMQALVDILEKASNPNNAVVLSVTDALNQLGLLGQSTDTLAAKWVAGNMQADAWLASAEAARRFVTGSGLSGRQHGIRNFVGGLVRVGEAGEELVRLPRGSDVIPRGGITPALRQQAAQAPSLAAHAEVNITTSLLKDFVELKKAVLRAVEEQLDTAAARAQIAKPRFGTLGAGIPRT